MEGDQVGDPGHGDSGLEPPRLREQAVHAVATVTVAHQPQSVGVGDADLDEPVHRRKHSLGKLGQRVGRASFRSQGHAWNQDRVSTAGQQDQIGRVGRVLLKVLLAPIADDRPGVHPDHRGEPVAVAVPGRKQEQGFQGTAIGSPVVDHPELWVVNLGQERVERERASEGPPGSGRAPDGRPVRGDRREHGGRPPTPFQQTRGWIGPGEDRRLTPRIEGNQDEIARGRR